MFKRLMFVFCFILIFSMIPACAFAADRNNDEGVVYQVMPRWSGNSTISSTLNITNNSANVKSEVRIDTRKADKVKFEINLLQYKSGKWTSIKKWSASENVSNQRALFSQSYKVDKNFKYKMAGTVKVYNGKVLIDTISVESSEKTA